tara:strand:- start:424 stop:600 length:177 start_codon:yes stop_codon:yes gene_type:complete
MEESIVKQEVAMVLSVKFVLHVIQKDTSQFLLKNLKNCGMPLKKNRIMYKNTFIYHIK